MKTNQKTRLDHVCRPMIFNLFIPLGHLLKTCHLNGNNFICSHVGNFCWNYGQKDQRRLEEMTCFLFVLSVSFGAWCWATPSGAAGRPCSDRDWTQFELTTCKTSPCTPVLSFQSLKKWPLNISQLSENLNHKLVWRKTILDWGNNRNPSSLSPLPSAETRKNKVGCIFSFLGSLPIPGTIALLLTLLCHFN